MPNLKSFVFFDHFIVLKVVLEGREKGVALVGFRDPGDQELVKEGEEKGINLGPPYHEDSGILKLERGERLRGVDHGDAVHGPRLVAGQDNILPPREGPTDGVISFATHHDGVAAGSTLEKLEILGEVPWEVVIQADHPFWSHGYDGGEGHGVV